MKRRGHVLTLESPAVRGLIVQLMLSAEIGAEFKSPRLAGRIWKNPVRQNKTGESARD
jgi:hypothetical protein